MALALAVVMLRLHRLTELPPALFYDEGAHGVDALRVLQGEHAVFFSENNGREGLIVYAIALATSLLAHDAGRSSAHGPGQRGHGLCRLLVGADPLWAGRGKRAGHPVARPVGRRRRAGLLAVSIGQTVLGAPRSESNSCHCFYACVWLCSGWGGGNAAGGGSCFQARVPGCWRTPRRRRVSRLSFFSSSA